MDDREKLDKFEGRKHRSSRTHKDSSQLELEELNNRNKKSNVGNGKIRKRSSNAGRDDEADSDSRRESRSKIARNSFDERDEPRTSEYHHEPSRKSSSSSSYDRDVKEARKNERRYSDRKECGREKDIKKVYNDGKNKIYEIDGKKVDAEKRHRKFCAEKEVEKAGISLPRNWRNNKQTCRDWSEDSEPQYSSKSHGQRYGSPERRGKHYREVDETDRGCSSDAERNSSDGKGKEILKGYYNKGNQKRSHPREEDKSGNEKDCRTWRENMIESSDSGTMHVFSDAIEIRPTHIVDTNSTNSGQSLKSGNVHYSPTNSDFSHVPRPRMPSNMMGSPFGPDMNFPMTQFPPEPLGWPDMWPNVHPLLPAPGHQRFVMPNTANWPNHPMCPIYHGMSNELPPGNWNQMRNSLPSGTAPSRGDQNDYSQNFVDTARRPQNFIRELNLTSAVEDYPKLRELIRRKEEIVRNATTPPMYFKCDLKENILSPDFFGTKFDVILVDPPWEEYAHRAPGVTDHVGYWSFEEILNLKIEEIADTPSFIFLWVGDGVGLEQGRKCLKKWGFRRCEDICWMKTNKNSKTPSLPHDSNTILQYSKEHCLMGIKGTVRRGTDGHIIHANIDTDIIISEEPPGGSTRKPEDMYRIIEHFALGKRRIELFGEDHNIRSGWLTVGKGLSSSNFNAEGYICNFADKDGKVWQGGGGRNPPPEAPHLLRTTPEIENLRPKSPPPKTQQPKTLISNYNNPRPLGDASQMPIFSCMKPNQLNWASPPMIT